MFDQVRLPATTSLQDEATKLKIHNCIYAISTEAISTSVFASAKCEELTELSMLQKLFEDRYGQKFNSLLHYFPEIW